MPPHCDTLDGPVVRAATRALELEDVDVILAYVPETAEEEVVRCFDSVSKVRALNEDARVLADTHFFETVVPLHRAGEGEPFTGLKPAGLGHGPVIPVAERAIETGDGGELSEILCEEVSRQVRSRLDGIADLQESASDGVAADRRYVSAMLALQVWAHRLYKAAQTPAEELHP